jgi:hypothetical protein
MNVVDMKLFKVGFVAGEKNDACPFLSFSFTAGNIYGFIPSADKEKPLFVVPAVAKRWAS